MAQQEKFTLSEITEKINQMASDQNREILHINLFVPIGLPRELKLKIEQKAFNAAMKAINDTYEKHCSLEYKQS